MAIQFVTPSEMGAGIFAGADPDYQLKARKVAALDTFKNGLPTDAAGNPDFAAMAKALYAKGDFANAGTLAQTGLAQQGMQVAARNAASVGQYGSDGGGQPATQPSSYVKPTPGFDSAVSRTLGFEGGLNPSDTNGTPSNYGINQAAHPGIDVSKLTPDQAKSIYKSDYWDAIGGDSLPAPLSRAAFDTAVIAGPSKAKQLLAESGGDPMKLMTLREQYQQSLLQSDPAKYGQYAKAWTARNNGLRYDILALNATQGGGQPAAAAAQPPASAASPPAAPVQVAQNGDSDAPSSTHPYAVSATRGPASPPPATGPADPGTPAQAAGDPPSAPVPKPAPMPISPMAPPPLSPNAGGVPQPVDPTYGGQVPPAWLRAGHSAGDWVNYARAQAAQNAAIPGGYGKGSADQWTKIADGLASTISKAQELTPEQKNARDPTAIGYEHQRDAFKAQARVDAQNSSVAVQGAAAKGEAAEEGKTLGQVPAQLASAADSARGQNAMIDEMLDAATQFNMGKFAGGEQTLNATVSALGHKLGVDTSSIDGKTAAYEDFGKLAGQFSRQAMKEAGGRAGGVQELKFIVNTLPSPTMSMAGFQAVGNQLKGLNDFSIAKQQAGEAWLGKFGSMKGFDADWNKNVTPSAFVMHRLQVDQPDQFSLTVQRLAQSAQGRAALQSMRAGLAYAGSAGLLQ